MVKEKIIQVFERSLQRLYLEDSFLIEHESSERSIVASLKCILKESWVFSEYIIDIEYNREGSENNSKKDQNGSATTADLIIHKTRWDTVDGNLLYLEAKTYFNRTQSNQSDDIESIRYFMNKFNYQYWMFLFFWREKWDFILYFRSESGIEEFKTGNF